MIIFFHWDGLSHQNNDYVVSLYISNATDANSTSGANIEFYVDGAWTPPQTLFTSVAKGSVVTRTYSNVGAATLIRISANGNDGFYYWKITVNGVTITENPGGIDNSPGSSSIYLIDGNGTYPTIQWDLPTHTTANNLSAIVRDEPSTHADMSTTKRFVSTRTTIIHYQMKLLQIGGITWYFHLTENFRKLHMDGKLVQKDYATYTPSGTDSIIGGRLHFLITDFVVIYTIFVIMDAH